MTNPNGQKLTDGEIELAGQISDQMAQREAAASRYHVKACLEGCEDSMDRAEIEYARLSRLNGMYTGITGVIWNGGK